MKPVLPPHLRIAVSVTEKEYRRAKFQEQIILGSTVGAVVYIGLPMILRFGIWVGVPLVVLMVFTIDKVLNYILRDARKTLTARLRRYPDLRAYLPCVLNQISQVKKHSEQIGADEPATAPQLKPSDYTTPNSESKPRSQ